MIFPWAQGERGEKKERGGGGLVQPGGERGKKRRGKKLFRSFFPKVPFPSRFFLFLGEGKKKKGGGGGTAFDSSGTILKWRGGGKVSEAGGKILSSFPVADFEGKGGGKKKKEITRGPTFRGGFT